MRWFRFLIAPTRIIYILFFIYIVCRFCSFSFENKLFTGWEEKKIKNNTTTRTQRKKSIGYLCMHLFIFCCYSTLFLTIWFIALNTQQIHIYIYSIHIYVLTFVICGSFFFPFLLTLVFPNCLLSCVFLWVFVFLKYDGFSLFRC